MKPPADLAPRFQKILNTIPHKTGCWLWNRGKDKCGYGKLIAGSRTDNSRRIFSAHRYSYSFHVGPIPAGLSVLHRCDTRACINPNHLYLGTQKENVRDAIRRGRWVQGKLLAERNRRFKGDSHAKENVDCSVVGVGRGAVRDDCTGG